MRFVAHIAVQWLRASLAPELLASNKRDTRVEQSIAGTLRAASAQAWGGNFARGFRAHCGFAQRTPTDP